MYKISQLSFFILSFYVLFCVYLEHETAFTKSFFFFYSEGLFIKKCLYCTVLYYMCHTSKATLQMWTVMYSFDLNPKTVHEVFVLCQGDKCASGGCVFEEWICYCSVWFEYVKFGDSCVGVHMLFWLDRFSLKHCGSDLISMREKKRKKSCINCKKQYYS